MRKSVLVAVMALLPIVAHAQGRSPAAPAGTPPKMTIQGWRVYETTLPDGKKFVGAVTNATTTVRTNKGEVRPTLVISCVEGRLGVGIMVRDYLNRDMKQIRFSYRADQDPVVAGPWKLDAQWRGMVLTDAPAQQFTRQISVRNSLLMQMQPAAAGQKIEATFSLGGSKQALTPVATACKLSL